MPRIPLHHRRTIKPFSARQTPFTVNSVVVQAGTLAERDAHTPERGPVTGAVLQATGTDALGQGHGYGTAEGQLRAGQVLTQQTLYGRCTLEGADQACVHPAF